MKGRISRRAALMLCLLAGLLLLPVQAFAAPIAPETTASLGVHFTPGSLKADGVEFRVYRVASVDAAGAYAYVGAFAGYGTSLKAPTTQTWTDLATNLPAYIAAKDIAPTAKGVTDDRGFVSFAGQKTGLYLVLGDSWKHEGVWYSPVPFLVILPGETVDGSWDYDVELACKWTSRPENEQVQVSVKKIWDDGGDGVRPSYVEVALYNGDKLHDKVVLNEGNRWSHTWTGLPAGGRWSVQEKNVPEDYTVKVEQQGDTFIITNYRPYNVLPDTGQTNWPVPVLAVAGLLLFACGWVLRRKGGYAE